MLRDPRTVSINSIMILLAVTLVSCGDDHQAITQPMGQSPAAEPEFVGTVGSFESTGTPIREPRTLAVGPNDELFVFCRLPGDEQSVLRFDRDNTFLGSFELAASYVRAAVAPDGDLVVAKGDAVTRHTPDGSIVWSQPISSIALAIDTRGRIYVGVNADANREIRVLEPGGSVIAGWQIPAEYVDDIYSVFWDARGRVTVQLHDSWMTLLEYTEGGTLVRSVRHPDSVFSITRSGSRLTGGGSQLRYEGSEGELIATIGAAGHGLGEQRQVSDAVERSDGTILVADRDNWNVQRYTADGTVIDRIGTVSETGGWLRWPVGIAAGATATYVVDPGAELIHHFSSAGDWMNDWRVHGIDPRFTTTPKDVDVEWNGNVIVTYLNFGEVQRFTANGEHLLSVEMRGRHVAAAPDGSFYVTSALDGQITRFDASGDRLTSWAMPYSTGIDVTPSGYVVVGGSFGVFVFTPDGRVVRQLDTPATSVVVDARGLIHVLDYSDVISTYNSQGVLQHSWSPRPDLPDTAGRITQFDINDEGTVYIATAEAGSDHSIGIGSLHLFR